MPRTAGYRLFDHTADVGVVAYGRDLAEAFVSAAEGLFSLVVEPGEVRPRVSRRVVVEAEDVEALLVDWLNELIYLLDAEGLLLCRFDVEQADERQLRATVAGEPADAERHRLKTQVKAATYHQVSVNRNDGVEVRVIFDI